ncbi:mannitol dehydrogenase family protein [Litorivivens sp.]|uniref:mannitol dehydrogenase family protein n=1 Tax=Litorivivens sp. TaxID=2020868 RepID=UPI003567E090
MKLCNDTLTALASNGRDIVLPQYDRASIQPGIVHLGVGAFHRAHQAWYTEAAMNRFGGNWGIIGVSLRRPAMRDALAPQDNLYSLVTRRDASERCQIIGALNKVLVASEQPDAVIEALAAPTVHVITLTVTEKGYGLDAASGTLNINQDDIAHDLNNNGTPQSTLGFLTRALALRQQRNLLGVTLISCDNLSDNGRKLRIALLQFARVNNRLLADWIDQHCRFPNTMVDRIVPATTDTAIEKFSGNYSFADGAPVFTEPFSQWVIERNFAGPVPPWDKVGAQFVDDVTPFEAAKLRTLNASHSLIAYLGCLEGHTSVAQAIKDNFIRDAVIALMREAEPTFTLPESFPVDDYQRALIERFENQALEHRCEQIAMDGSQKIPQRIIPVIEWHIARDSIPRYACLTIAAWLGFLRSDHTVNDPLADTLRKTKNGNLAKGIKTLLAMRDIFPATIADHPGIADQVLRESHRLSL